MDDTSNNGLAHVGGVSVELQDFGGRLDESCERRTGLAENNERVVDIGGGQRIEYMLNDGMRAERQREFGAVWFRAGVKAVLHSAAEAGSRDEGEDSGHHGQLTARPW